MRGAKQIKEEERALEVRNVVARKQVAVVVAKIWGKKEIESQLAPWHIKGQVLGTTLNAGAYDRAAHPTMLK
jgi:hypothetical protein